MRDWMDVAVLAKTRNMKGRLVVRSAADLPFLLEEGDEVAFVPPQTDLPRRAVAISVHPLGGEAAEVVFDGVDGDTARGLVGCHCLMRRADLDGSLFEEEPALWDGWEVVDCRHGLLGSVAGVADNPGQELLEVDRADGKGMLLIPAVDAFVRGVDVEAGTVRVSIPDGLLDL